MVTCCVCKASDHKSDADKNIKFHEIPCNQERRAIWLRNIRLGKPNYEPSDRSSVCSRHFLPEDYKEGMKIKVLKTNAIPTVFPEYPLSLQAIAAKAKIRKPPIIRQPLIVNLKKAKVTTKVDSTSKDEAVKTVEPIVIVKSEPVPTSNSNLELSEAIRKEQSRILGNSQIPGTFMHRFHLMGKKLSNSRKRENYLYRKLNCAQLKISTLKTKLKDVKVKLEQMEMLKVDAANGSLPAMFLVDQINMYSSKRTTWREEVIRECIVWRLKSSIGYDFIRKRDILKLPSRSTIQRFLSSPSKDSPVTEAQSDTDSIDEKFIMDGIDVDYNDNLKMILDEDSS